MTKSLKKLCNEIEAGYAAGKSGVDDDMIDLVLELADRTAEIKELMPEDNAISRVLFGPPYKQKLF